MRAPKGNYSVRVHCGTYSIDVTVRAASVVGAMDTGKRHARASGWPFSVCKPRDMTAEATVLAEVV